MNDVVQSTASANTDSQKVEISFNTGTNCTPHMAFILCTKIGTVGTFGMLQDVFIIVLQLMFASFNYAPFCFADLRWQQIAAWLPSLPGDILLFEENASIILVQALAARLALFVLMHALDTLDSFSRTVAMLCSAQEFSCDVTSANVPVWAYHETIPSSVLPYEMGVQSALNLNEASYTIMLWLKQGASEPDDTIIIGQFIDTSTTTTLTVTSTTMVTATSTTSSTTQSTTWLRCTCCIFVRIHLNSP